MKKVQIQVSIILCISNEGNLMHYTIKSIRRAMFFAHKYGLKTELIIISDNPNEESKLYLKNKLNFVMAKLSYKVFTVTYSNVNQAKNYGVNRSKGHLLTFIDPGDLMSENWLYEASKVLKTADYKKIIHPEYDLCFDQKDLLWKMISTKDDSFNYNAFVEFNYFCSLLMCSKEVVLECPFYKEYTHTNWQWSYDTLTKGIEHLIAKKTILASRILSSQVLKYPEVKRLLGKPTNLIQSKINKDQFYSKNSSTGKSLNSKDRILSQMRQITDSIFRSRLSDLAKHLHPRFDLYINSLRNETLHLLRPLGKSTMIPEWLITETLEMHKIDPRIFLSDYLKENIPIYSPAAGPFTIAYWDLVKKIGASVDILYIVPYLKNGGAELALNYMVNYIITQNPSKKLKVLATDQSDSPWAVNLDKRIQFIEPCSSFFELNPEDRQLLLAMICVQTAPKKIHLMNSQIGYSTINKYGAELKKESRLFITIFSIDKTPEGRNTHMFIDNMQTGIVNIEKVFTDNATVVNQLIDIMAIDASKFRVIYNPVDTTNMDERTKKFTGKQTKILWAGRIDRQKRPDIIVKIADLTHNINLPVEFDIYGSSVFNEDNYLETIKNSPNINYKGGYKGGLFSLPLNKYDIFILTSEWEGMPNVILEAAIGGLLIIAPNVGGVAETINNRTGYLIDNFDNPALYLEAIKKAIENPDKSNIQIKNLQNLILSRHTKKIFDSNLSQECSYIN